MKKILTVLLLTLVVLSLVIVGCTKEKTPIKISDLNWGSAHFQSETAKIMIEAGYEYPAELVPGKTIVLLQGLRTGDLDVVIEGWLQNQQEAVDEALAADDIVMLGILNNDNWQSTFVVPTYVIKGDSERGIKPMAPDLKTVSDLINPDYKELFKNPENPGKGMIMNGIPGWECEKDSIKQVETYGLDDHYDLVSPGSQETLFASLKGAYDKGEPWLGYMWGPTWISGLMDLTLLEEPAFDKAVWEKDRGCAFQSNDLFIAAHKDFPDEAPELVEMFGKWRMNSATLAEALAYMHDNDAEPKETAIWFLKNREEIWTPFVPADVASKIKEAVAAM